MPEPFPADIYEMLAILLDADVVDITWGSQKIVSGFSLSPKPRVAKVQVPDESQAWAVNLAKEALGEDDIDGAFQALKSVTGPVVAMAAAQ
jgi:hypothetical protein